MPIWWCSAAHAECSQRLCRELRWWILWCTRWVHFFVLPSPFFTPILQQLTKLLHGWTDNIVLIRQNLHQFFCPAFVNWPKFTGVWWGAGVDEWAALNWVWHQKQQDTASADLMGLDPGPFQLSVWGYNGSALVHSSWLRPWVSMLQMANF